MTPPPHRRRRQAPGKEPAAIVRCQEQRAIFQWRVGDRTAHKKLAATMT